MTCFSKKAGCFKTFSLFLHFVTALIQVSVLKKDLPLDTEMILKMAEKEWFAFWC